VSALTEVGLMAWPITTLGDVECLRQIRNACRLYMTNDTGIITPQAQAYWYIEYRASGPTTIQVWLLAHAAAQPPLGFFALRHHPYHTVITLGLIRDARNRGYGTAIYTHAREIAGREVRATIARDNARSIQAAKKAGYVVLYDDGGPTIEFTTAQWAVGGTA